MRDVWAPARASCVTALQALLPASESQFPWARQSLSVCVPGLEPENEEKIGTCLAYNALMTPVPRALSLPFPVRRLKCHSQLVAEALAKPLIIRNRLHASIESQHRRACL